MSKPTTIQSSIVAAELRRLSQTRGYYTVEIPPASNGATPTIWHDRADILHRGAFKYDDHARVWAAKNIPGHMFRIVRITQ